MATTEQDPNAFFRRFQGLFLFFLTVGVAGAVARDMTAIGYDEFYHLLAARSWLNDAGLTIGTGYYDRASLFTKGLALYQSLFGHEVTTARWLPIIGAAAWVYLVFSWTRSYIGTGIAWLASILLILSSTFLHISTNIRFYSWHGFASFLIFYAVCEMLREDYPASKRIAYGFIAGSAAMLGFHLQSTTAIAILSLVAWLTLASSRDLGRSLLSLIRRRPILGLSIITITVAAAVAISIWALLPLWQKSQAVALWNEGKGILFYNQYLQSHYATFWGLYPAAALIAVVRYPKYGSASVVIFVLALAAHSVAGMKAPRYLMWAMPFFFITNAIALSQLLQYLQKLQSTLLKQQLPELIGLRLLWRTTSVITLSVFLIFLAVNNRGIWRATEIIAGDNGWRQSMEWTTDWSPVLDYIVAHANSADALVTSHSLASLYYLDRSDFVMSKTVMMETDTRNEFGIDPRTGRPVISAAESLERILNCYRTGLLLVDPVVWGDPIRGTSPKANELILERSRPITQIDEEIVLAFRWTTSSPRDDPQCRVLRSHVPHSARDEPFRSR